MNAECTPAINDIHNRVLRVVTIQILVAPSWIISVVVCETAWLFFKASQVLCIRSFFIKGFLKGRLSFSNKLLTLYLCFVSFCSFGIVSSGLEAERRWVADVLARIPYLEAGTHKSSWLGTRSAQRDKNLQEILGTASSGLNGLQSLRARLQAVSDAVSSADSEMKRGRELSQQGIDAYRRSKDNLKHLKTQWQKAESEYRAILQEPQKGGLEATKIRQLESASRSYLDLLEMLEDAQAVLSVLKEGYVAHQKRDFWRFLPVITISLAGTGFASVFSTCIRKLRSNKQKSSK